MPRLLSFVFSVFLPLCPLCLCGSTPRLMRLPAAADLFHDLLQRRLEHAGAEDPVAALEVAAHPGPLETLFHVALAAVVVEAQAHEGLLPAGVDGLAAH